MNHYMALSHKDWELQIHEFDWLKLIFTAVQIFPSRPASRQMIRSEKVANQNAKSLTGFI